MKRVKVLFLITVLIVAACLFGCAIDRYGGIFYWVPFNTGNEYNEITESPFKKVSENPTSSFALYSNTAAYSNLRRYINEHREIDKNMVRIEDMVNYFKYDYALPEGDNPLAVSGTISPCPWNSENKLLTIAVSAKDIKFEDSQNNLVFLLDISGSMNSPDKMPLMQAAFCMLTENLNDDDYVSIIAYAGDVGVVLNGARGFERKKIQNAVEDLDPGGCTAGAKGIETAYKLAEKHFIEGGNNRIILATDGDFNVGASSQTELETFIAGKKSTGVGLTILGFGYGNLKDNKLETLASASGGNHYYIDSILEARKVLVEEIGGTLDTVAKDVKANVVFNLNRVESYRLLGYENKMLTIEEWDDPERTAGDIGAGHCVTAVYEIVLSKNFENFSTENFLKVSIRYKDPKALAGAADKIFEIQTVVSAVTDLPNDDIKFISAVVEAALVMRNSQYKGTASLQSAITRLESIENLSADPYKTEFLTLMKLI